MEKVLQGIADWISGENRRIIIGISGHGASGKTTFAHNLMKLLGQNAVNYINTDPYIIGTNYSKSTLISSQNKINIVEGMSVAFTDPNLYDLKVYLYTDGETELVRRGIRDVSERGTDMSYLRKSHSQRRVQYELFMHPYHRNFDIVIKNSNEGYVLENINRG